MKNKELKKTILQDGTYQEYTQKRKQAFMSGCQNLVYDTLCDSQSGEIVRTGKLNTSYFEIEEEKLEECEKLRKNKNRQRQKIEDHIKFLFDMNSDLYFLTITFTDEALNLQFDTRKQKIRRVLSNLDDYILNIDYGKTTEREHYHAIISIKKPTKYYQVEKGKKFLKIKELDDLLKCGFYSVEEIRRNEIDIKKLSRYINKLTLHSVKVNQQYVSVKKGSKYQIWKKFQNDYKKYARNDYPKFKKIGQLSEDEYLSFIY